eukprot:scaffold38086_cov153-Amphora_coffeaeformis.AAC.1
MHQKLTKITDLRFKNGGKHKSSLLRENGETIVHKTVFKIASQHLKTRRKRQNPPSDPTSTIVLISKMNGWNLIVMAVLLQQEEEDEKEERNSRKRRERWSSLRSEREREE